MDQQQNKAQKSGGNGFIFGVIVGVLIALLFTTKKGRAILRDITEKGIDKLSSLEELTKKVENGEFDEEFEDDYVKSEPSPPPKPTPAPTPRAEEEEKKTVSSAPPKPAPAKAAVKPEPKLVVEEEDEIEEPQVKAPTKVIQGRRWFRGLKKK